MWQERVTVVEEIVGRLGRQRKVSSVGGRLGNMVGDRSPRYRGHFRLDRPWTRSHATAH
jgi:hypothetical protein